MTAPQPKSPVQSKTIWANVVAILIAVLLAAQQWIGAEPTIDLTSYEGAIALAVGWVLSNVGNIFLRFWTKKPVEMTASIK